MGSQSAYGGVTTMSGATTIGSSVPKDATPVDRLQAQLEWLCTKGGGILFEYLKYAMLLHLCPSCVGFQTKE